MTSKKGNKAKVLDGALSDLLYESQFIQDSPSNKNIQKRQRNDITEEEEIAKSIGRYQTNLKKKKLQVVEACSESCQKILDVKSSQQETWKEKTDNLIKNISEVMTQLEADCNMMKENSKKLEHLMGGIVQSMQQVTTAQKQTLKAMKDIHSSFEKLCEEMETDQKTEDDKLSKELKNDIQKLHEKLISVTKSGWENLSRSIFQAIQNDF